MGMVNQAERRIKMEFRKSTEPDIKDIMNIVRQGQAYFRKNQIPQWLNGYPGYETIMNDIKKGYGYVLLRDKIITGTVAVSFDGEKTYENIYDGKWLSDGKYAVIHRIAVASDYKGLGFASVIIKNIEGICLLRDVHSIRADTHRANLSMQRLLKKNSFQYCGIIYLEDGSERIAFEKLL